MSKYRLIIFHGFRATGKTTISNLLAEKLGWPVVDLDHEIVEKKGQPIAEITKNGTDWLNFRTIEYEIFKELLKKNQLIISSGGGTAVNDIVDPKIGITFGNLNYDLCQKEDMLNILLEADESTITNRIRLQELENINIKRPILNQNLAQTIAERLKTITDPTERKNSIIDAIVDDSLATYEKRKKLYHRVKNYAFDTSKQTPKEIMESIFKLI